MFTSQFLLSSQFISNRLVDSRSTASPLNVSGIKTSHVILVQSYPVLIRILFWAFEDSILLNLGMIETISIMSPSGLNEVFLASGYLRWVLLGLAIKPCSIRDKSLFIEGVGFMIGELVISHKFIMDYQIILLSSNRHMEHRIFGRELTNLAEQEQLRAKRNYSFLHNDKLRENKATLSARNRNLVMPSTKHQEQKTTSTDPQMVPEYFEENLCYLRSQETKNPTFGNYISDHKSVSQNSRAKLIDWLSELHYKYKMFPETIFTVVTFIDRYLAKKSVPLAELQLVGIAALLIAAKFQQTYQVPHLKQLITASAGQYTPTQLLNMEADMLNTFNFQLISNSSYKFFQPLSKVADLEPKNIHLGQYVLELALTKPKFLSYEPSMLASATIYLIKKIRRSETAWSQQLSKVINYRESELKTCAKQLCSLLEQAPTLQNCKALKKKFSLPDFHEVTKIKLQRKK